MSKVLLIEDDLQMQTLIKEYLEGFGYFTEAFDEPKIALKTLKNSDFDIVILDLMLPSMDGFDVCKEIKNIKDIPVIISSARGDIGNKIMGYELGADDYLAKPYEPRELVLRIEAVIKRTNHTVSNILEIDNLSIDIINQTLKIDGYEIALTKIEFDLLLYLVKQRGSVVSREQLINTASLSISTKNRTVDMHISNLRYKMGDDPKNPKYIKSVWGIGYKFLL